MDAVIHIYYVYNYIKHLVYLSHHCLLLLLFQLNVYPSPAKKVYRPNPNNAIRTGRQLAVRSQRLPGSIFRKELIISTRISKYIPEVSFVSRAERLQRLQMCWVWKVVDCGGVVLGVEGGWSLLITVHKTTLPPQSISCLVELECWNKADGGPRLLTAFKCSSTPNTTPPQSTTFHTQHNPTTINRLTPVPAPYLPMVDGLGNNTQKVCCFSSFHQWTYLQNYFSLLNNILFLYLLHFI